MDALPILLVAIATLLLGGVLGFFLGRAQGAAAGRGTAESLRIQLDGVREERDEARAGLTSARTIAEEIRNERERIAADLAGQRAELAQVREARETLAAERADYVRLLDAERSAHGALARAHEALKASLAEREKAFEERLADMVRAREALKAEFAEVGGKLLGDAQKAFLERANERFAQAGEAGEARIKALLDPVGERLKSYEEQVARIEKERTEAYGDIKATIEHVRAGTERVQVEAARLVNSLRNAPKARGRWGEQQLRNVLESCGLSEYVDFRTEVSVTTEEGRLRPDAIVRVPGNQQLIIDAKVSLNAYQDAFEANDDDARRLALSAHAASMKAHITTLGAKAYQAQFDEAPDYVVMFIPGEHFLSAALEHEPTLWDYAFDRKVLLATPTNLVAIARTVAGVWRQEKVAAEAKAIAALGKEMHDRLHIVAEHLRKVGGGLSSAVNNYNKFVGSFDRQLMSTGRKFAALNVDTGGRALAEVPELEVLPRHGETGGAVEARDAAE